MPSHLNRVVFRTLLADRPLLYRGCLHRPTRPRAVLQHGPRVSFQPQRRGIFNMFKTQRKIKPPELPPGLETMSELAHAQREDLRPPTPSDVAQALTTFFAQKDGRFEDFHIDNAYNSFVYLLKHTREDGQPWLAGEELDRMFWRLVKHRPDTGGEPHLALGRLLHVELKRLTRLEDVEDDTQQPAVSTELDTVESLNLILLLSAYGANLEARDLAAKALSSTSNSSDEKASQTVERGWGAVLRGLATEDNRAELLKTVDIMKELAVPMTPTVLEILSTYFAQKKEMEQAKYWYLQLTASDDGPSKAEALGATLPHLLKTCALCQDFSFGQEVVTSLLKELPGKDAWDAIFIWSAAIGKGPDEIDRMMNVLVRRNSEERQKTPSVPEVQPDIDTINALVEFSMSKEDPYSAERYITLGEKRGIFPNEKTFTMQIQYRLSTDDVDGARAAYYGLQGSMSGDDQSVAAVNQLVRVLCQSQQHHFDDIMAIVDDLRERRARLAPETVAALCVLHLRRGESHDAVDLLQTYAFQFSPDQRIVIRKNLAAFILDGQTSTADAWDGYKILRLAFPETPREDRIPVMNEFFARKRSDMSCHVFFHMRNNTHSSITATRDVYVAAFTGFARNADAESLELVHNQLKLDLSVEMNTQLRNALMLAYAATDNNRRALEFWAEIGSSKEGPTYNSIAIAFRSCEGMPFGDQHAKSIWRRLKEMDIDIDKKIFTAYLSAIARNHLHDEALVIVESAEEEYGFTPDLDILGNWFNMTTNSDRQLKVEEWIKTNYPGVWTEFEALGYWITMDGFGYRQYHFNRDIDP